MNNQSRRIMLTDEDFNSLVRGGVVRRDGIEVALSDIGWDAMEDAIRDAQWDKDVDTKAVK